MSEEERFRTNSPEVVQDTIDGEVVIVNLKSGHYYSLDRVGAEAWALMEQGHSLAGIIDSLSVRYPGAGDDVGAGIRHLFEELQRELIVVPADGETLESPPSVAGSDGGQVTAQESFQAPVLNKYSDMQDLLLLDPIHDVDDKGWPNAGD